LLYRTVPLCTDGLGNFSYRVSCDCGFLIRVIDSDQPNPITCYRSASCNTIATPVHGDHGCGTFERRYARSIGTASQWYEAVMLDDFGPDTDKRSLNGAHLSSATNSYAASAMRYLSSTIIRQFAIFSMWLLPPKATA